MHTQSFLHRFSWQVHTRCQGHRCCEQPDQVPTENPTMVTAQCIQFPGAGAGDESCPAVLHLSLVQFGTSWKSTSLGLGSLWHSLLNLWLYFWRIFFLHPLYKNVITFFYYSSSIFPPGSVFLTDICFFLCFRFLENKLLNKIISLIHTLWLTNVGGNRESKKKSQEKRKFLPIQLVNEFLYILITLVKHIRWVFCLFYLYFSINLLVIPCPVWNLLRLEEFLDLRIV